MEKINHYSLENPASVYDEEALTALELSARTAAKVNGCVDAVNEFREKFLDKVDQTVADLINRLIVEGMITVDGLRDSGNAMTNWENILAMLSAYGVCKLAAGEFLVTAPIPMREGQAIIGAGTAKTTLNVVNDGLVLEKDANHINVADLTLKSVGVGMELNGNTTEPYNGARYATFRNVDVIAATTGVELRGAWCVKFDHCRFFIEAGQRGVKQTGTCNNVVYDHCQFIGLNEDAYAGVEITAEGGAQNCGISFRDCDFEKLQNGIRAYCVVGLNVLNIYAEGVETLFRVDSCPNFNVNGGYAVHLGRLCSVNVSNANDLYQHSGGKISNLFCTLKSGNGNYLINAKDPRTYNLTVENVFAKWADDNGSGDIYYFDRDLNQAYGAACFYPRNVLWGDFGATLGTYPITEEETVKVIGCSLLCKNGYTAAGEQVTVTANGKPLYTFNIGGKAYAKGEIVKGTPVAANLLIDNALVDGITIDTTSADATTRSNWQVNLGVVFGKMIANKEVQ